MTSPRPWRRRFHAGLLLLVSLPALAAPPVPGEVMVAPGDGQVTVTWTAVPGAARYQVKRSLTLTGPSTLVATNLAVTRLTDTNLTNGRTYYYAVSASDADVEVEGPDSDRLRVSPSAPVLDLLVAGAKVEKLAAGFQFIEGPAWLPSGGGFLVFSDINANRLVRWTAADGPTTFRQPSGQANGNTVDRDGRLLTCEHLNRRVSRTEPDGTVTPLVTEYAGKRFNAPNDGVMKSDGSIWFTDPNYGAGQLQPGRYLYRFDPANGNATVTIVSAGFDQPNGLCFSPDESRLYVADSGTPHHVKRFDVLPDNTLTNVIVFAVITPGNPDGMRVDAGGRLFVAAGDGVQIFSPDGQLVGKLRTPESAANVGFGGPSGSMIFITASTALYGVSHLPDLAVTAITRYPVSPIEGRPVRFRVTVKNQGTSPAPLAPPFRVALTIDQQTNALLAEPRGLAGLAGTLPPDGVIVLECDAGSLQGTWVPGAGSHTVRAEVDDQNAVSESNERNNSLQSTLIVDAPPADTDADGLSDTDEAAAGTLPSDPASVLRIVSATRTADGAIAVSWSSIAGKSYVIACKSALEAAPWTDLPGVLAASGPITTWTGAVTSPVFLRVKLMP